MAIECSFASLSTSSIISCRHILPPSSPISFTLSLHFLKVLCTLLVVPSIFDFGKSIWQAAWWGVATADTPNATIVEHHVVAPVQIVTPIVFVVDMVCFKNVC